MAEAELKILLNPIDKYVGSRVRMRRLMVRMSQEKLGEHLGLTFKQVQKYEKGMNRTSASRIVHIAEILGTTPEWLFEGVPKVGGSEPFRAGEEIKLSNTETEFLISFRKASPMAQVSMVNILKATAKGE